VIAYISVLLRIFGRRYSAGRLALFPVIQLLPLLALRFRPDGTTTYGPGMGFGTCVPLFLVITFVSIEAVGGEREKNRLGLLRSGGLHGPRAAFTYVLFSLCLGGLALLDSTVVAVPYFALTGSSARSILGAYGGVAYVCLLFGPPTVAAGHVFARPTALLIGNVTWFALFLVAGFAGVMPALNDQPMKLPVLAIPVLVEGILVVVLALYWNRLTERRGD
jgi:hypothetical protein